MWNNFSDQLPTTEFGKQVKIFFCEPGWATFAVGLYTHWPDLELKEHLMWYHMKDDRYSDWVSRTPTHWMKVPEMPKKI